ncbi:MerR family transcriptional regulator [Actinoplanes utahensis]|uniref:MerR family transcriptional regulator n=1 Tax=Actinoplanes utahensis TaxID=1869 RepID=UPI000B204F37|nr:MerR family transcriptional regulator [Actinoplanes utahensis]
MTYARAGGRHLLTIGRLAAYAGVTVKAVRVYHERGLLAEPPRDSSGYRRYGADHAVQLVKIRTLAEAGVPLARIRELLDAGPEQFAAAIDEIDRRLRDRAEQIRRTRQRITRLRGGDRLFVTEEVAAYLDTLREIGVSERGVLRERELWVLLQAAAPEQVAAWIAGKAAAVADPEFRALYRDYDEAYDWPPDDPRLAGLAERTRDWFARQEPGGETPPGTDAAGLLALASAEVASPAWNRIAELAAGGA